MFIFPFLNQNLSQRLKPAKIWLCFYLEKYFPLKGIFSTQGKLEIMVKVQALLNFGISMLWNFFFFFFCNLFFFFYLLDIVSSSSVWPLAVSLRMTLNSDLLALTRSGGLQHHLVCGALGIKLKAVPIRQTLYQTHLPPFTELLKDVIHS